MKASALIRISDYVKRDGTAQLYLLVVIDGAIWREPLDRYWPPARFDLNTSRAQPRHRGDQDVDDLNLLLAARLAKATRIFTEARLRNEELTVPDFVQQYTDGGSKDCFLKYFAEKLAARYARAEITKLTHDIQRSSLRALTNWVKAEQLAKIPKSRRRGYSTPVLPAPRLPFSSLRTMPANFDHFLRTVEGNGVNTRWARHKDIKAYLSLARREGIRFDDCYAKFRVAKQEGKWRPITLDELRILHTYYKECPPRSKHRQVLQRFLFACNTGLRVSDQKAVRPHQLIQMPPALRFPVTKGRRHDKDDLFVPLTAAAWQYAADSISENAFDTIFTSVSDQGSNSTLREIRELLGLQSKLHHHAARETFATHYIELGGNVAVLKEYLGHSQISTTMKYVHISERAKVEGLALLDRMYEQPAELKPELPRLRRA